MSKAKGSGSNIRHVIQQQVQLPSSGNEFRKGGNVLSTSDPKAPATNPFVQAQNQGTTQGKSPAQSCDGQGKNSK
jgi:hypothetical protein